ncbi:MAG: hypothetical protein FWD12_02705 [Alphaproteobacteria bacterium]|nr:hypothetical protein [Alphaproteobacteria bacterium]
MVLPLGPPGLDLSIGVDGLSSLFLLLLFVLGAVCSAYAMASAAAEDRRAGRFVAALLAVLALALLAADATTLFIGLGLSALASWTWLVLRGDGARAEFAGAVLVVACLLPTLALLASGARDPSFAAMRASPPEGWRAAVVLLLVLLGLGGQAVLAPLLLRVSIASPAVPGAAAALLSGGASSVAIYGLIRVLFDLCGPAQPLWWGVPLVALGAGTAVLGARAANHRNDLVSIFAAGSVGHTGLVVVGLGVALLARGADLPALTALALGVALFQVLAHGVLDPMLILCAGSVGHGAGSRALARLGGLVHAMPLTTAAALAGCASVAAIPPGPGFAGFWLLVRSLSAASRIGGVWLGWLMTLALLAIALAGGLTAAANVRVFAVVFLGRPRTPRAAAAEEMAGLACWSVIALAVIGALLGLLPRIAFVLAEPALRALAGSGLLERVSWFVLRLSADAPGYAPVPIALLLTGFCGAVIALLRRWSAWGVRRAPAWMDGFAAPPPWLPFGDPRAQYGGAPFAQPIGAILGEAPSSPPAEAKTPPEASLARPLVCFGRALALRAARLWRSDPEAGLVIAAALLGLLFVAVAAAEAIG